MNIYFNYKLLTIKYNNNNNNLSSCIYGTSLSHTIRMNRKDGKTLTFFTFC